MALLITFLTLVLAANAVPASNWPVNSQLPPVARVSQPFQFVFSEGTFTNNGSNMTYSLSNAPSWLKIDNDNRTLSGTPGSGDVGYSQFDLVASDQSGSAQMDVTFVVSAEAGPAVGKPILPQLAKVGSTSIPSTLFMYPGRSFSFSFESDTFLNTYYTTTYYATSSTDNSPLPSWIGFNAANLSFSGSSPSSPSSGPQTFTFNLIASDVPGFSGATVSFQIVVESHILAFKNNEVALNFTPGQPFSTTHFSDILTLDSKAPASSDIANIKVDGPDWLKLDNDTISLTGTAPQDAGNENVTISVTDIYQDVATLLVSLEISQLFAEGVESCNATIGQDFSYVFATSLLSSPAVNLTVDLGKASSWANYDSATRTLSGHIPDDMEPQTVSIKLIATEGSTKEMRNLDINITKKGSNDTDQNSTGSGHGTHKKKAEIIAIAVVVPVVGLISLAILLCCWLRRRRAAKSNDDQEATEKLQISRPISEQPEENTSEDRQSLERCETGQDSPTDSGPPRLELGPLWEVDSLRRESSGKVVDEEAQLSRSMAAWGFGPCTSTATNEEKQPEETTCGSRRQSQRDSPLRRRSTTNYSRKREPLKTIQSRSFKRDSTISAKSKRYSRRSSGIPSVASGLPVRLSGAGHGAGGFGPPGHGTVRISWQNTQASFGSEDSGIENLAPLFPRPPKSRTRDSYSSRNDRYKRLSLRPVRPSSSTISETDFLEAFIQGRAKSRNSDSPMFSARPDRRASSGLRALEKARRTPSGAGTTESLSIYADEVRQSPPRPISTAMSGSVYTDDVRQSVQLRPLSEVSNLPQKIGSQSNFAKKYSEIVSPLPSFWSHESLASNRQQESGDSLTGSDDYHDLIDEREEPDGQRCWYEVNPVTRTGSGDALEKTSETADERPADSDPMDSRVRHMSLVRTGGQDSSPGSRSDRRWRLGENQERRPVSIEDSSSLHQTITGSVRGNLAFV